MKQTNKLTFLQVSLPFPSVPCHKILRHIIPLPTPPHVHEQKTRRYDKAWHCKVAKKFSPLSYLLPLLTLAL